MRCLVVRGAGGSWGWVVCWVRGRRGLRGPCNTLLAYLCMYHTPHHITIMFGPDFIGLLSNTSKAIKSPIQA